MIQLRKGRDRSHTFFDREAVVRALGKGLAGAMAKVGAFVRASARKSIKIRALTDKQQRRALLGDARAQARAARLAADVSPPGSPPFARTRNDALSLRAIEFEYDAARRGVVIGPVLLGGGRKNPADRGRLTVPELHEFGGTATLHEISRDKGATWSPGKARRALRPWMRARTRQAVFPARPFMGPALDRELKNPRLMKAFERILQGGAVLGPSARRAS